MRVRTPILEAIGGLSTEGIREEAQRIFEHDTDLGQVMAMMYDRIIGGPEGQRYLGDRHFQIPNAKMLVDKWGALVRTYPDPRDAAIALAAIKMDGQNFIWDQLEGNPSLDRATIAEYHKQLRQLDEEARTSDRWGLTDLEWRVIETVWGERGELLHDQQRQYDTGPATDEANS